MTFCEINPRFRFLKYTSGDHFAKHADEHYKNDKNEISLITVLIYINDDYEGGNTKFLFDDTTEISITPKIGLICLMDQNILHEVPKLITGIKYVIRTELMYK
jgi:predicted 2-oxoglutarate/Fe(II)-dependent dioxygenase YbiX